MAEWQGFAETRRTAEIVVLGGGLSAVTAALAARAAGRQVLLVAPGQALADEVSIALWGECPRAKDPHLVELVARVLALGGVQGSWLDPPITELVVDRLLTEAGVDVLLYTTPVAFVTRDGAAAGVLVGAKDGLAVIAGAAFVDATADGALYAASGAAPVRPARVSALRTVYLQFCGDDLSGLPARAAGCDLALRATWPGEACLELRASAADDGLPVPAALAHAARLAVPTATAAALAAVPGLAGAVVSHTGHRLLPLAGPTGAPERHPALPNVSGAGAWVGAGGWGDLDALAASGTAAGRLAARIEREVRPVSTTVVGARADAQVAVVGGGTGGALAAIAAARRGARTVLAEAGDFLGGIGTGGGIHLYYHGVQGGIQAEVDEDVRAVADVLGGHTKVVGFSPEAKKVVLEQMADQAGVELRYGHTVVDVMRDGQRVTGVVLARPGALTVLAVDAVVDASGDGDVAAAAGASFVMGRASDGVCHAFSQSCGLLHGTKVGFTNFDAGFVDAGDSADLTRARRLGIQLYWPREPFRPDNRMLYLAPLLGLRQSRHVVADYVLTLQDQIAGRSFTDDVAYGKCHYDNHAFDLENESDEGLFWCWGLGFWSRHMSHGLPYRSLLPSGVEGVVMGSRALGVSHDAHMLFRMQRDMQRIGEAAGTAAALAALGGTTPRALGAQRVQAALHETGAWLSDWHSAHALAPVPELVARLGGDEAREAAWQLYLHGDAAVEWLCAALHAGEGETAWWAASLLAMLGHSDGVEVLRAALVSRDATVPGTDAEGKAPSRAAARWKTAIALLGKLNDAAAVDALAAVLADPEGDADALLAAVRALGRIADPHAVAPLQDLAGRVEAGEALPKAYLQNSMGPGGTVERDVAWQVRDALADALERHGHPRPELVDAYTHDQRAYVRAEAERLAEHEPPARQAGDSGRVSQGVRR